jgi:hypothetical protein
MSIELELWNIQRSKSDVNEDIKEKEKELKKLKAKAKSLRKQENELLDNSPSPFTDEHIKHLIVYILENESTAINAFRDCSAFYDKEDGWLDKVKKYIVNPNRYNRVIEQLLEENNEHVVKIQNYELFSFVEIGKGTSYSALLLRLKKVLSLAEMINGKDEKLGQERIVINKLGLKIGDLSKELETSLMMDEKTRAVMLKKINPKLSYIEIGKMLGIPRQKASNHINGKKNNHFKPSKQLSKQVHTAPPLEEASQ